jgi:ubiquinone/menaquinone biosynthesis C-methylase UbiE
MTAPTKSMPRLAHWLHRWTNRRKKAESRTTSATSGSRHSEIATVDPAQAAQVSLVTEHYEKYLEDYQATYGPVLQSVRGTDVNEILDQEIDAMGLADGMSLLDIGCGFAGPAIHFAQNRQVQVTGITLGEKVAAEANAAVATANLADRIDIIQGDFHHLDQLVSPQSFDRACFLESLGHAHDRRKVLSAAFRALRPGGLLLIKDWLALDFSHDPELSRIQAAIYAKIEAEYHWRMMSESEIRSDLAVTGFEEPGFILVVTTGIGTARVDFDQRVGMLYQSEQPRHIQPPHDPYYIVARRP